MPLVGVTEIFPGVGIAVIVERRLASWSSIGRLPDPRLAARAPRPVPRRRARCRQPLAAQLKRLSASAQPFCSCSSDCLRGLLHVLPGGLVGVLDLPQQLLALLGILAQLGHRLLVVGAGLGAGLAPSAPGILDLRLPDRDLAPRSAAAKSCLMAICRPPPDRARVRAPLTSSVLLLGGDQVGDRALEHLGRHADGLGQGRVRVDGEADVRRHPRPSRWRARPRRSGRRRWGRRCRSR